MKKLMVIAAAAAMVGGAFAAGYDFTASVKTTKGKYGSQKTTYTVNLGLDDNGEYWWDSLGFADEKAAKDAVKKMTNDEKADFAWNYVGFDGTATDFNVQEVYKGRKVWCYTFKFSETAEDCYRVAGSAKLKGVITADCCGLWEFAEYDFGKTVLANDDEGTSEIANGLLYRFGGVSLAKANKVEVAGTLGDVAFDGLTIGTFAFAGQGAFDVKNDLVKNVSGNIVGVLDNPDCESCCDYDDVATVYECADEDDTLTSYLEDPNGTAAFGTFSIKYNKKY
jgi:hypothetical protein